MVMRKLLLHFSVFAILVALNSSCATDPCDGVTCENGGTCNSGKCDCPDGFSGSRCEIIDEQNFTFVNKAPTDMQIWIDGEGPFTIESGGSRTFSEQPGTVSDFYASTSGKTTSGTQVGALLEWEGEITYESSAQSLNLIVTSTWFFLKIKNNTVNSVSDLYVNYGLVSQTYDNITFGNGGPFNLGYYKAFSNGNVRIYKTGTSTYYYWNQGTHYNLPNTDNQVVSLLIN